MNTVTTLLQQIALRESAGTLDESDALGLWSVVDLAQRLIDYANAMDTTDRLVAAGRIDDVAEDTVTVAPVTDDQVIINRCLDVVEYPQDWADPDDAKAMAQELVEQVAAMMERQQAA